MVVVAWRPSQESSRALHDALPLLRRAAAVQLVMVDPRVGETSHGELPGADIAEHLARHGLRVEVVSLPREGVTAGVAIRSEEPTSELQALMRIAIAGSFVKQKTTLNM